MHRIGRNPRNQMKYPALIAFVLGALPLVLGGCSPAKIRVEPPPTTFEEGVDQIRTRTEYWQNFQARLRIRAESPRGRMRLNAVVLAQLPEKFRLEAFNVVGQTAGLLLITREGSSLYIPSEKVIFTAASAETLIEHFLGIPIQGDTFGYSLIAGAPPEQLSGLRIYPAGSGWRGYSEAHFADRAFSWEFMPRTAALKTIGVRDGQWTYTIAYEPAVLLTPREAPKKIGFESSEWKLEVTVDEIQPSKELPDKVFVQSRPAGIREIDLDGIR